MSRINMSVCDPCMVYFYFGSICGGKAWFFLPWWGNMILFLPWWKLCFPYCGSAHSIHDVSL